MQCISIQERLFSALHATCLGVERRECLFVPSFDFYHLSCVWGSLGFLVCGFLSKLKNKLAVISENIFPAFLFQLCIHEVV
jgi:hypothetical protein